MHKAIIFGASVKLVLLTVMLILSGKAAAFDLTEKHCQILGEEAKATVDYKAKGISYESRLRDLLKVYGITADKDAFSDMFPYVLAVVDEYYHTEGLESIDYAASIERSCKKNIGSHAQ